MRIGIFAQSLPARGTHLTSGVAHYTHELIRHLLMIDKRNSYVLFCDGKDSLAYSFAGSHVRVVDVSEEGHAHVPLWFSHQTVARIAERSKIDVLHSPASVVPLAYRGASVVTIHDLLIYEHPEWFPRGQWWSVHVAVPKTLQKVNAIIAVSNTTKESIARRFPEVAHKVRVVPNGVSASLLPRENEEHEREYLRARFGIAKPYVLFVGTLEPRKNIERLVRAFDRVGDRDTLLVLAGRMGWRSERLQGMLADPQYRERVRFVGSVSEDDKIRLMRTARTFIFPSLAEGFGLPILEAMREGVPVIVSRVPALVEVGGSACVFVDPQNEQDITKAINNVLQDESLRTRLIAEGERRVRDFSWERTARETLRVYESL